MSAELLYGLILGLFVFDFLFEQFLNYLNSTRWTDILPKSLEGIFDAETFKKQQKYSRENSRFDTFSSGFSFIGLVVVLSLQLFGYFDEWLRLYIENEIIVSIVFFSVLAVVAFIAGLPFSIYDTFVIEQKYGFNKTTPKIFVFDMLKSALLSIVIGIPLMYLVLWIYSNTGTYFWIYVLLVIVGFLLFMLLFYSNIIVPLFNKQKPLEQGELRDKIQELANKAGFKLKNIFVIDGSKRSTKANAYFTGLGSRKRIVLYDTLLNDLNHDEVVAVLAHEIGHYKGKHVPIQAILSLISTTIMLYLFSLAVAFPELSLAMGASQTSFHIGITAFGILYGPISMLIGLLGTILSRKFEYQADNYAKSMGCGPFLVSGLKKLSVNNLSNPLPHPITVFFTYSHPPLLERIKNIEK